MLAWALCLLCVGLAVGALLLWLLNGRALIGFVREGDGAVVVLVVSFSVVGALILSHRPENTIGWILCAAALFQALSEFGLEYATYALITRSGALPLGAEMSWLADRIWAPGLGLILVFLPLFFPDGRPPSRRWRPVAWLGGLAIGLISVPVSILTWPERGTAVLRGGGIGDEDPAWLVALVEAGFTLMLLAGLGAVISLFVRFHRARGDERQQIKWFAYAAVAFGGSIIFGGFLGRDLPGIRDALFEAVTLSGLYVAVGVAILRYRLYEIDLIINPTLVYGLLTATLVLVYLGGVVLPRYVFHALTGQESQLAVVASTLVIAALFNPLRRRIQIFIDRLFTGAGTTRRRPSRPSRRDFGMRPISAGWVTSWSRRCGRPCSRRTPRCGCARQLGSARRKGEARCEKISVRGVFVTLFVTFGRRSGPRMVVKEVR